MKTAKPAATPTPARTEPSMDSDTIIFCGADDGHDSVKLSVVVVRDNNGSLEQLEEKKLMMPSKVVRGNRVLSITGDDNGGSVYRTSDGEGTLPEEFTVTDALSGNELIDTRSLAYATSTVNRVLVYEALQRAGLSGKDVRLVTGLPVVDYYTTDGQNKALIDQKRRNIQEGAIELVRRNPPPMPNIVQHNIACEGIAAVYDLAIRDDGSDDPEFIKLLEQAPVGVIDIGGKTIDLAVVYLDQGGHHQIDRARTQSINFGMLRVGSAIEEEIRKVYSIEEISPRVKHRILSEGTMMLSGEQIDVSEQVDAAINKVLPDLFTRIRQHWAKASDLSRVIVVGGGSYLLADKIKEQLYKHAESRPEPEYANSRGMLKMAMRQYVTMQQRQLAEATE